MARVTGIGGVFLRARDPQALTAWYAQPLGVPVSDHGTMFLWSDEVPPATGMTIWSLFPDDTTYFGAGPQNTMVNFRVDDLDALLNQLNQAEGTIHPQP